ncbi:MAG: hypothetical protein KC646_08155 [Candidatus Cloacimonetes bacterium]|nr:hypothetical protein [Candidatus Cloacimonadota bacterium]
MEFMENEGDQVLAKIGDLVTVVNPKHPLVSLQFEVMKLMRNAYGTKLAKSCKPPAKVKQQYMDKNGKAKNVVIQCNEVFQID